MVKKYDIHGTPFHTPPYTEEELAEFDRIFNKPPVAIRSLQQPRRPQDLVIPSKEMGKPDDTG